MYKLFTREIYLWQGILLFVFFTAIVFTLGFTYTFSVLNQEYDPVPKIDREMLELQGAIKQDPDNPNNYVNLGQIYYEKGSENEAIKMYLKALSLNAEHPFALYNLSTIYTAQKEYEKAEEYLVRLLSKFPEHESANLTLAKVLIATEQYKEAEELLKGLSKVFSGNADYYYYLALACEKLEKSIEANKFYDKALQFDPEFKEALEGLERIKNPN